MDACAEQLRNSTLGMDARAEQLRNSTSSDACAGSKRRVQGFRAAAPQKLELAQFRVKGSGVRLQCFGATLGIMVQGLSQFRC